MIFNDKLLFIHVPKTGGMAVSKYLLEILPRPVYYSHPGHDPLLDAKGIIQIKGIRHENLDEALQLVQAYGKRMEDFADIVAILRNPYDLEVSRFAYLQKGNAWDKGLNQDLALTGDFQSFAVNSLDHCGPSRPIESYFMLAGQRPKNLRILRTESLERDLASVLRRLGIASNKPLLRENRSQHQESRFYYTRTAEAATYQRYRWVFDNNFYSRWPSDSLPEGSAPFQPLFPCVGPLENIRCLGGLWPDNWAGREVVVSLTPEHHLAQLIVEGRLAPLQCSNPTLQLRQEKIESCRPLLLDQSRNFTVEFAIDAPSGKPTTIKLTSSAVGCPEIALRNDDQRELSFHLRRIVFIASNAAEAGSQMCLATTSK